MRKFTVRALRRLAAAVSMVIIAAFAVAVVDPSRASAVAPPNPPPGGSGLQRCGEGFPGGSGVFEPSPSPGNWWPGTDNGGNGGPFACLGAHYGDGWGLPTGPNNSTGIGFCLEEGAPGDPGGGTGSTVALPLPPEWDERERANASAVIQTFGFDLASPYGLNELGWYNAVLGEWMHPWLGEVPLDRFVAAHMAIRQHLEDVSDPATFVGGGFKMAPDTSVSGDAFMLNDYEVSQHMAAVGAIQSAVGALSVEIVWDTPDGLAPQAVGAHTVTVRVTDSTGKSVGFVPVSTFVPGTHPFNGGSATVENATISADNSADNASEGARVAAAEAAGWPEPHMAYSLGSDARFGAKDVANAAGEARFTVQVDSLPYEVSFAAWAPGDDLEFYNGNEVQNHVTTTAGSTRGSTSARVEAPLGYIEAVKTVNGESAAVSYTSPDGTVLDLRDSAGVSLGQQVVAGGVANWSAINIGLHAAPFSVYELDAADGVQDPDPTTPVATIAGPVSQNPAAPSTVNIDNQVVQPFMEIAKVLTTPAHLPPGENLGGFEFSVTRDDGASFGTHTTTAFNGRTNQIVVTYGTFTVCEVGRPPWAIALTDPPAACIEVVVDSGDDASPPIVFEFVNVSHAPEAASVMATPFIEPGGRSVDWVWMRDAVPGRSYEAQVTWFVNPPQTDPTEAVCTSDTAAFSGSALMQPATGGEWWAEVAVDVPADAAAGDYYAAGQIVDLTTGVVIDHLECGDLLERATVMDLHTVSPYVVDAGAPVTDTYTVTGVPTIAPPIAITGHLPLHDISTDCTGDSPHVGTITETITTDGTFTTSDGIVTTSGVYVFREYLVVVTSVVTRPTGFSSNPPGIEGDELVVEFTSTPELCNPAETTWAVEVVTQVQDPILTGQPSVDVARVLGLPGGDLHESETARLLGGLYWHDSSTDPSTWECDADNLVAEITPIAVTGNGDYTTEGITGYPVGVHLSYQEQLVIERAKTIAGEVVAEQFVSRPHGCRMPSQTQYAEPAPTTTTATTVPSTSSTAPPTPSEETTPEPTRDHGTTPTPSGGGGWNRDLPSTGARMTAVAGVSGGVLALGVAVVSLVALSRRRQVASQPG